MITSLPPPGLAKRTVRPHFGQNDSLIDIVHQLVLDHKLDNLVDIKVWCKKDEWESEEGTVLVRDLRALSRVLVSRLEVEFTFRFSEAWGGGTFPLFSSRNE